VAGLIDGIELVTISERQRLENASLDLPYPFGRRPLRWHGFAPASAIENAACPVS
jgi:hypothetical protein